MSKNSKHQRKLKQAKTIALKIVRHRKQLANLKRTIERTGSLDDNRKAEVKRLVEKVNKAKKALEALGFDPSHATSWAKTTEKKTKLKGVVPKQKKRDGIGMYGLGSPLKVWK